uniref:Angel homolog 1 n=1 Tax=Cynoglossus semilaevis TaxID=244447 RepID=A0A3P8UK50_CYNSE
MIGSLLFYALYPLSRYLTAARRSDTLQKGLPPAEVHGTAQWNGGTVTTRRFAAHCQSAVLDQKLDATIADVAETKERMKDGNIEMERSKEEPQSGSVKSDAVEDKPEVLVTDDFDESGNGNKEDATCVQSEDLGPEQALELQLKCLQTDEATEKHICSGLAKVPAHAVEETVVPAEDGTQETICPVQKEEESSSVNAAVEVTECWDEYWLTSDSDKEQVGANSSRLVFPALSSSDQNHTTISEQHNTQTSWHFPAGLGLAEEVECPLWQFPVASYYPSMESIEPFEVMWRVWQRAPVEEPDLVPFPFSKTSMEFTVMSYNILAQDLLETHEDLYMHCPLEVLDWNYRCKVLLDEIVKWNPDILCLQEVQENHYHEQLYPVLSQIGYTCVYKCRTGAKTDGCATCYRSCCFSEVSVSLLEFFRPDIEMLNRHNVGIVLLLRPLVAQASESKTASPLLCVGNTHLLFNPRRGDVKLAQAAMMLAEIDSVVTSAKAKGEHCNVVLCGDFNSVPHMPLYQLITTGNLYYQHLPAWMISGQEDMSYKTYCHRLAAPLWPSSLGITDKCQYSTVKNVFENQNPKSGKRQYSHDFMQQLRFCPAACVRPVDLQLIPGVTDNTPDVSWGNPPLHTSFRHTLTHPLDLESVYKHVLPGSGCPEVTTLHSEVGATVDYIFYQPLLPPGSKSYD